MSILTAGERKALDALVDAWNLFIKLPDLHESDKPEFMAAIHAAQNIILARPAVRDLMGVEQ